MTDESIEALNICEYVLVKSRMHGIDERYLLNKADIFIAAPQKSVYHLGAVKRTFDDAGSGKIGAAANIPKNISAFSNDAKYVSEEMAEELLAEYAKGEDVKEIVVQCIEQIPSGKEGLSAYEVAVKNEFIGTELEWLESLKGKPGGRGEDGISPTIRIGTVTTGEPGTEADVKNAGTVNEVVLDFIIPRGSKGEPGGSGAGANTELAYDETLEFLNSDLEEDVQPGGGVLSYDATLDFLNSDSIEDV